MRGRMTSLGIGLLLVVVLSCGDDKEPIDAPDTTPPVVAIVSPTNGAQVAPSCVVTGTASDNFGIRQVRVSVDGGPAQVASGTTSWSTPLAVAAGSHVISVVAEDTSGNLSNPVAVTVQAVAPDSTPPTVTIVSPTNGAQVSGQFDITGTASDNVAVREVLVSIDGGAAQVATGTTSWSLAATIATAGPHAISVVAEDTAGNLSPSATVSVEVVLADTTPPTVTIVSPTNGAQVSGHFDLTGTASDNVAVREIRVSIDGGAAQVATGTTSWSLAATIATVGPHAISVVAEDTAGNLSPAAAISVEVMPPDTTLPEVVIVSPTESVVPPTFTITGTASDNVGVREVRVSIEGGSPQVATGTVEWSLTVTLPSGGDYLEIVALAEDLAGNVSAPDQVYVLVREPDTTPPTVTISSPFDGEDVPTSFNVHGYASDNEGVNEVRVSIDGGADQAATGTASWSYAASIPAEGPHSITVVASDAAGNHSPPVTVSVTVVTDLSWALLPFITPDGVSQAAIASNGSDILVHYHHPHDAITDHGVLVTGTGSSWSTVIHPSNECHDPDVVMRGQLGVIGWTDDTPDCGFGSNPDGSWLYGTGTGLNHQYGTVVAIAHGRGYMAYASRASYDPAALAELRLHVISPAWAGSGGRVELTGWTIPGWDIGLNVALTGDDTSWYVGYTIDGWLRVMEGWVCPGGCYRDFGYGFRMAAPPEDFQVAVYQGKPTAMWTEEAGKKLYIGQWNGSDWILLGQLGVTTGMFVSGRMVADGTNLYIVVSRYDNTPMILVNRFDGAAWSAYPSGFEMEPNTNVSSVDIALWQGYVLVSYCQSGKLIVVKHPESPGLIVDGGTSELTLTGGGRLSINPVEVPAGR